jgi:hypothetical protein
MRDEMPQKASTTKRAKDITLRAVPPQLYNALLALAETDHRSLAGQILFALEQYVEREQRTRR